MLQGKRDHDNISIKDLGVCVCVCVWRGYYSEDF